MISWTPHKLTGVTPNMMQRVMVHQHLLTTLDLYTRQTDNNYRIRGHGGALGAPRNSSCPPRQ